ncbi:hypothetical protein [Phormidium tenue]|uniref:Uncharacterized protein n=1 Tax=Phormidium tenue NIES-30 TaxID=549789 RepID=A0A1U7J061_9CYAN|nr:hypothetical protein [Phormidium tenue]MBD2234317.1 hypothetical protein [Phormidium tenue FACHB-1052]OKH44965.1 hypothetical protein NIES30_20970 [Phormidium tenue NIES-30]
MEFAIVLILVFIVWTNEALLGKPLVKEIKPKTAEDKFTAALKEYLDSGIPVRIVEKKDGGKK